MDEQEARRRRAEARRGRVTLRWVRPGDEEPGPLGPFGASGVALTTQLSRWVWELSGRPWPTSIPRDQWSYHFVRDPRT